MRRGGITSLGGGGPSQVYGPTAGVPEVRAGTAVQAVTDPGGGVTFTTWNDLAGKIAANPSGTTFVHAQGGVINDVTFQINTTTKAPKIYFLGVAGSTATVLDGQNETSGGITALSAGDQTEVYGGEWKGLWRGIAMEGSACVIQDNVIHNCWLKGFNFGVGIGCRATRVYVHSNGDYNLSSSGGNGHILEYCHIANGNTRNLPINVDAGAMKFAAGAHDFVVRNNWVEGNNGPGIWCDGFLYNMSISENVVENNIFTGIFYELSYGGTSIHHNAVLNNAPNTNDFGSGNLMSSGSDATVQGSDQQIEINNNLIDGNGTQVQMGIINHSGHGLSKGTYFHDNDVTDRGAAFSRSVGLITTNGTVPLDPASNNLFASNRYHVPSGQTGAAGFAWGTNQSTDIKTFTQWQAVPQDAGATIGVI